MFRQVLATMIRNGLYSVVSKVLDGIEGNSGFMGTYDDDGGAEFEATALVGKRSARLKMVLRLLIPDQVDGEVR